MLCLLDDVQLAVLDRTEPNYERRVLDTAAHPVLGAPDAGPVGIYVSRHGVVIDPRLPAWSDPPPSQAALLGALLAAVPIPGVADPAGLSSAARSRPALADEVTALIQQQLSIRSAGL